MRPRLLACLAASLLVFGAVGAAYALDRSEPHAVAAEETTTTAEVTTSTTELPTTTTEAPTTTTVPPPTTTTAPPPPPGPDLTAFGGLGTWVDVYDWTAAKHPEEATRVTAADIDEMKAVGVQTLFLQTGAWDLPGDLAEPERLLPIVQRAESVGIAVVAWYLPTYLDEAADLSHLLAAARVPGVDGLGVDIESQKQADVALRSARLLALSHELRRQLPTLALGAIPYPPIVTDVLNGSIWPGFPWVELAGIYDVWLPMSYQTFRAASSPWRQGYTYTAENVDRLRANLGRPGAVIHTIGGIADATTAQDVVGMIHASGQRRLIGASLYDWNTTRPELWPLLRAARNPNRA
jgi:hypothetical protein